MVRFALHLEVPRLVPLGCGEGDSIRYWGGVLIRNWGGDSIRKWGGALIGTPDMVLN